MTREKGRHIVTAMEKTMTELRELGVDVLKVIFDPTQNEGISDNGLMLTVTSRENGRIHDIYIRGVSY